MKPSKFKSPKKLLGYLKTSPYEGETPYSLVSRKRQGHQRGKAKSSTTTKELLGKSQKTAHSSFSNSYDISVKKFVSPLSARKTNFPEVRQKMEQKTELIKVHNVKGSKSLSYLRGEIEADGKQKEVKHTIVFFGKRVEKIKKIVELLVRDARQPLTEISRKTGIPVSTVYDNVRRLREQFRFTIIPKEIYYDEEKVLFEVAQTNMQDFNLPKAE